jgi:cytochrome P450
MGAKVESGRRPVRLSGSPVLGHLADFRQRPLELLDRCAEVPGPVVELRVRTRTYVLKGADDIRHVLVSSPAAYEKSTRLVGARARRVGGQGVFFRPAGGEHRRGRAVLRPSFGRGAVARRGEEIVAHVGRTVDRWDHGGRIDLGREANALAFRSMLASVFGTSPEERPELAQGILVRRRYLERSVRTLLPRPRFVPVAVSPASRRKLARLDRTLYAMLADERSSGAEPSNLLSGIARAGEDGNGRVEDNGLRDQLLTIGITGFVSVGSGLTWALYELARHPALAARVEAEVDAVLDGRPPSPEDLDRLPYCDAVVSEALRLYPPSWLFMRITRADDELPSGVTLRSGAKVLLSPYLVQRSPAYYEDPERFDPDRFAPAGAAERPRFAYFPFGGGQRVCVGREFALLELRLMLASLAQRVRLNLLSGEAELYPHLTLRPRRPILMRVRRRR